MAQISNTSNPLYNFVVRDGHGIKGLVESGLSEVPEIYIQPINERINKKYTKRCDMAPIDLSKLNGPEHDKVVDEIVRAAKTLGFFQVVNHGAPLELLESLKASAHAFYNMPTENKVACRRGPKTIYGTSFIPDKESVWEWRDYLRMQYSSDEDALQDWPDVCKEFLLEYLKLASKIIKNILSILIGNLGVELDDSEIERFISSKKITVNYYPPCPNPDLTIGAGRHADTGIMTVLLQDGVGGLYVKVEDDNAVVGEEEWFEIPPIPGALIINIGDALQIISNGKYKSAEHRVMTPSTQSRVSIGSFTNPEATDRIGPIPELVKKDGLPIYREVLWQDYLDNNYDNMHQGKNTLDLAKINYA